MLPPDRALIECVPNFSEGRDRAVIEAIAQAIEGVEGVCLRHIDIGAGAHRSVMTFMGAAEAVCEAAFRSVQVASKQIDMRLHHGAHPRLGATDVLPLIPLRGISLSECAELARRLAKRIADELGIPCFLYEAASPTGKRLEQCRRGEYEGLQARMEEVDVGPRTWSESIAQTGATIVGARPFLLAVNFNLNTPDQNIATAIARELRTSGYHGHPGLLPAVKAIGWYIPEYGIAQVSMNLCDLSLTPLHVAWQACSEAAQRHGVQVTGTEIIGLVPTDQLRIAEEAGLLEALHLDDLAPFHAEERVI